MERLHAAEALLVSEACLRLEILLRIAIVTSGHNASLDAPLSDAQRLRDLTRLELLDRIAVAQQRRQNLLLQVPIEASSAGYNLEKEKKKKKKKTVLLQMPYQVVSMT